ncbi:MAG: hypothetical protein ACSLFL_11300 [Alphaproteobacteria bacterium]
MEAKKVKRQQKVVKSSIRAQWCRSGRTRGSDAFKKPFDPAYEQGFDMNDFDQQPFSDAEFAENPGA